MPMFWDGALSPRAPWGIYLINPSIGQIIRISFRLHQTVWSKRNDGALADHRPLVIVGRQLNGVLICEDLPVVKKVWISLTILTALQASASEQCHNWVRSGWSVLAWRHGALLLERSAVASIASLYSHICWSLVSLEDCKLQPPLNFMRNRFELACGCKLGMIVATIATGYRKSGSGLLRSFEMSNYV